MKISNSSLVERTLFPPGLRSSRELIDLVKLFEQSIDHVTDLVGSRLARSDGVALDHVLDRATSTSKLVTGQVTHRNADETHVVVEAIGDLDRPGELFETLGELFLRAHGFALCGGLAGLTGLAHLC